MRTEWEQVSLTNSVLSNSVLSPVPEEIISEKKATDRPLTRPLGNLSG
jgi:hypothetical protein